MITIWTAIAAAAKKAAIMLAKRMAKKKAADVAKRNKLLIVATIVALFLSVFFVAASVISLLANPLCAVSDNFCEQPDEAIVKMEDITKASERGTQLRSETNGGATVAGENFREYQIRDEWKEGSPEKKSADSKTGAILTPGENMDINPADWLTGDWQGLNEGFALRLARFAKDNGRTMYIRDGMRPIEEQWRLWNCWKAGDPSCNMAAYPGTSDHGLGLAADVNGWGQFVQESELKPYGLCRPLLHHPTNPENWHYVPCEIVGAKNKQNIVIDGYGGNFAKGDTASELFVYWLVMRQTDQMGMTSNERRLESEMKKGTKLGKTYKVALEMKKGNENGSYNNPALKGREKTTISDYLDLARFEIQKCYLIGDTKIGFWENITGSETPCADIDKLAGEKIVPVELRGVIGQTEDLKVCATFSEDGTCERETVQKTVVYRTAKDIVYMYEKISTFGNDDTKVYREYVDYAIKNLFEEVLVGGLSGATKTPDYIVPFEDKTYKTVAKFGQKVDGEALTGVLATTSAKNNGVYATAGGEVVRSDSGMVLLKHSTGYHSQYEGFKSKYAVVGKTVSQGEMIASFGDPDEVLFSICKEVLGKGKTTECVDNVDPEGPPAMLAFSFQEDATRIAELEEEWAELVKDIGKKPVIMPGFSPLSSLGSLSAKYETGEAFPGERAGLCVHNSWDPGGMSCGSYQIATNVGTMREYQNFLQKKYPNYFNQLSGVPLVIGSYGPAWKKAWEADKQGFYHSQHDFIADSHYQPILKKVNEIGIDISHRHPVIQDVVWSFAVQHRYNTPKAFKAAGLNNTMSDAEFITKAYDTRIAMWPSLSTRYKSEKQDALNRLR